MFGWSGYGTCLCLKLACILYLHLDFWPLFAFLDHLRPLAYCICFLYLILRASNCSSCQYPFASRLWEIYSHTYLKEFNFCYSTTRHASSSVMSFNQSPPRRSRWGWEGAIVYISSLPLPHSEEKHFHKSAARYMCSQFPGSGH